MRRKDFMAIMSEYGGENRALTVKVGLKSPLPAEVELKFPLPKYD